jgi:hypothetical protein
MSTQTQALLDPQIDDAVRLELREIDGIPIGEIPEERPGTLVLAYDEIAPLAYEYWHQRGCPDGSPEIDWLRAEQELVARGRNREASYHPA